MSPPNPAGRPVTYPPWVRIAGAVVLVGGSSALALAVPALGMGLLLLCAAAIFVLRLRGPLRTPALLGAVAPLGLYFSTGIGSVDLPAVVPLSVLLLLLSELGPRVSVPRLPRDFLGACLLFAAGLLLGMLRGPNGREGVRTLAILVWLLCVGRLASLWSLQGRLNALLRAYSVVAAGFGIVNLVFFIFPSLEEAYFGSWISHVFVEPDSVRRLLTGDELNNALSPDKAATLYIDANVTAMFFGTEAWSAYGSWRASPWRPLLVAACVLGAIGTVSRGGALGAMASLFAWAVLQTHRGAFLRVAVRVTALILLIGAITIGVAEFQSRGFTRFAWATLSTDPRFLLWGAAVNLGMVHPVLGSGFGAWESYWPPIANVVNLRPSFPPHNVYLFLWIIGGVAATLGFLWIALSALRRVWHLVVTLPALESYQILATGAIVVWCWTQANFENFFFLDYRIGFLLAVLFGGVVARRETLTQ